MSKRRTRKQKEKAKHKFLYQWSQGDDGSNTQPTGASNELAVKGQIGIDLKTEKQKNLKTRKPDYSVQSLELASTKKNIGKSVMLASLILSLELVIYLIWR